MKFRTLAADPRHFQIAVLGSLLIYGLVVLDFGLSAARLAVTIGTALFTQTMCAWLTTWHDRLLRRALPDLRSAFITSLSLCLLLRTDSLLIAAGAAALAIAGKYLFRIGGKHVFNPANLGVAAFTITTSQAWVSPGQWGSVALLGFSLAGLGGLVVYKAARSDVTYAFLLTYAGALFARAAWLGDPWTIPGHQLASGALLLFAFFMVSDPKTTPNSRPGRILHGVLVAVLALAFRFRLHEPDGLLWSLFLLSPLVPLWDRVFGGSLYRWETPRQSRPVPVTAPGSLTSVSLTSPGSFPTKGAPMHRRRRFVFPTAVLLGCTFLVESASAFCGFYVAKADAQLFNRASQVVLVRDGDRTVLTMASDYQGDPAEFALVVPVPTVLQEEQIHVAEQALLDHLDAYTAPRLVEYFDEDPCLRREWAESKFLAQDMAAAPVGRVQEDEKDLGVTIEAKYTVGEYDILILSAEESGGLETWLVRNGYRIPSGASRVLGSYLKQGMKFFVAKVNLEERAELGFQNLRPLQMAFESPKFMLPLRLGTVNAEGPQDLFVYALTRTGRVESVNYRTVKLPSDVEIPPYVKDDFANFYTAMFAHQWKKEGRNVVFLEYAWDMNWCDPCAADPLSSAQLRELGVYWVGSPDRGESAGSQRSIAPPQQAQDVYATRLHVRYDAATFPEDLVFRETGNRENFQGRYVLRHPWPGEPRCDAARDYVRELRRRQVQEAENLASLTGWDLADIRRDADFVDPAETEADPWWRSIWR